MVLVDGQPVELFARQFDLLTLLVRNEGRVMRYEPLGRALWGVDLPDDLRAALRTAMSKLRRVLGVGERRPVIETEHHVGYRLVAPID